MNKFFNINQNKNITSLKDFNELHNKICILRSCGGLGDIINMRMIFADIKNQYPEFEITWGLPNNYFPAAEKHPYVDKIESYSAINPKDFIQVYNLTNICTRYEWAKGKENDKNRADIWSDHIGVKIHDHKTYMPNYSSEFEKIKIKLISLGWDQKKKIVLFAPRSAIAVKNLLDFQCAFIKKITQEFFLVILHSFPILDLVHINIPMLTGISIREAMAAVQFSDLVVSTDTGLLHVAGGYGKHGLGLFCYTDGYLIAKYYPTIVIVQRHYKEEKGYCGPCNNFKNCKETDDPIVKPCLSTITNKMIEEGWMKMLENYSRSIHKSRQ